MTYMFGRILAAAATVLVMSVAAEACSMGSGSQHNYDHDGTANCDSCDCAHLHQPPAADLLTEVQPETHGHPHPQVAIAPMDRLQGAARIIQAACQTYNVVCGQDCTSRQVKNGGVWITVRDCKPRYCPHTTCN